MGGEDARLDNLFGPFLRWLEGFGPDLIALVGDPRIPAAVVVAGIALLLVLALGTLMDAAVELAPADADAPERVAVRLAVGIVTAAACVALVLSGGRSASVVVALASAATLVVAALHGRARIASRLRRSLDRSTGLGVLRVITVAGVGVLLVGVVYGTTIAPSPRGSVQPLEFADTGYYSMLGRDLLRTGAESGYGPSGFDALPGAPPQWWYHWGELWLASAVIGATGLDAALARHAVVLPLVVVSAALLAGATVQRLLGRRRRSDFVLGALASIALAPFPAYAATYFGSLARGSLYGVTTYGLGLLVAGLATYLLVTTVRDRPARAVLSGVMVAALLPTHVVLALAAAAGVALAAGMELIARRGHGAGTLVRPWAWSPSARLLATSTGVVLALTLGWGIATGHGLASGEPFGTPFGLGWAPTVLVVALCSGAFLLLPVAAVTARGGRSALAHASLVVAAILVAGAVAWGARVTDFNAFHLFVGPIVAFAPPAAVAATRHVTDALRGRRFPALAGTVLALLVGQMALGGLSGIAQLEDLGGRDRTRIPIPLLDAIRALPPEAKVAYACDPQAEFAIWNAELAGIAMHTDRPMVAMCFQADVTLPFYGLPIDPTLPGRYFRHAPQRALYPDAGARPSEAQVVAFLREHGIAYVYSDPAHRNRLTTRIQPIVAVDGFVLAALSD